MQKEIFRGKILCLQNLFAEKVENKDKGLKMSFVITITQFVQINN
jgi:hypothetical protein